MTKLETVHIPPSVVDESGGSVTTSYEAQTSVHAVPEDPTVEQRMIVVEASGALSFWDHPDEDVYSLEDGEPV